MKWGGSIGFSIFLLIVSSSQTVMAQNFVQEQSTHSLGMAGAVRSFTEDDGAFFLNPGGLARQNSKRWATAFGGSFEKFSHWGVGGALIDGRTEEPLSWGFLGQSLHWGDTRKDQYSLGLAVSLFSSLYLGLVHDLHYFGASIDDWAYSLDVGAMYLWGDHLALGISSKNLAQASDQEDLINRELGAGISFHMKRFRISTDASYDLDQKDKRFMAGGEFLLLSQIKMRGGYTYEAKSHSHAYSVGASNTILEKLILHTAWMDFIDSKHFRAQASLSVQF